MPSLVAQFSSPLISPDIQSYADPLCLLILGVGEIFLNGKKETAARVEKVFDWLCPILVIMSIAIACYSVF